jgi:hypothetical protein
MLHLIICLEFLPGEIVSFKSLIRKGQSLIIDQPGINGQISG